MLFSSSLFKKDGRAFILFNGVPYTGPFISLLKRHGVTEVLFGIGNPAAVKTDELRISGEFLNLLHLLIACQNTDMTGMISVTNLFCHFSSPLSAEVLRHFSISVLSSSPVRAWASHR